MTELRLWQNGSNCQVNVGIQYNGTYATSYSFEPFSSFEADGQTRLANMRVTSEKVVRASRRSIGGSAVFASSLT